MDKGILYLVPTPIGNLGDMTYRGVEVLKQADVIAAEDTRTSLKLLNHYQISNKLVSYHKFNESKQTQALLDLLEQGQSIALITDAGTPGISDPASKLVQAAIKQGITVTCLPGPTAVITALAASGLNTDMFTFAGFLPPKVKERKTLLDSLKALPHTLVLYESSHRIRETLDELSGYFAERQCVVARELSKLHESFYRGTIAEILALDFDLRGEFVILISGKVSEVFTDEEIEVMIRQASGQGLPLKEIASQIAAQTGISRNRIYQLALTLKANK